MEAFFGASFQSVRIHVDPHPLAFGADAFTVGEHIHFAPGRFHPSSPQAAQLLAHELTHVLQQRAERVPLPPVGFLARVADPLLEWEAELAAAAVTFLPRLPALLRWRLRPRAQGGGGSEPHAAGAVLQCGQCEISELVHNTEQNKDVVLGFLKELLEAVEQAYQFAISNPTLGPYAELDGHTGLWVKKWEKYNSGKSQGGMASAFGYVIETLATMVFLPQAPSGMSIRLQEVCGPTRPDVVLVDDTSGDYVAWFDFTAKDSGGHIWGKIGWGAIDHVAEIVYPSTDMKTIQQVSLKSPGFSGEINGYEIMRRLAFAKIINGFRREHWQNLGQRLLPTPKRGGDMLVVLPQRKLNAAKVLAAYFGLSPEVFMGKVGASVIAAFGRSAKTFGFTETESVVLGESFLLQNDPGQPRIEIPRDAVPRSLPVPVWVPVFVEPEPLNSTALSLVPFGGQGQAESPPLFSTEQPAFTFTFPQQEFFSFQQSSPFSFSNSNTQLPQFPFSGFQASDTQPQGRPRALLGGSEDREDDRDRWRGYRKIEKLKKFLERNGIQRRLTLKQLNRLLRNKQDDPFLKTVKSLRAILRQRRERYFEARLLRTSSPPIENTASPFVFEFQPIVFPSLTEPASQEQQGFDENQSMEMVGFELVTQGEQPDDQEEVVRLFLDPGFTYPNNL
jgi:uncharacterized protein DUF4157